MTSKVIRGQDIHAENRGWGPMRWLVNAASCPKLGMTLGRVSIAPGASVPLHSHPDSDEVLQALSGRLRHQVPGHASDTLLNAGDTLVLRKGGAHAAVNPGLEPCELLVLCDTGERRMAQAPLFETRSRFHHLRPGQSPTLQTPWGSLTWLVMGSNSTSNAMTFGLVTIKPGQANPHHQHPNCDEILYLLQGSVSHTLAQGGEACLEAGDAIVIGRGAAHHACNVGVDEAVMAVAFNSSERKVENV